MSFNPRPRVGGDPDSRRSPVFAMFQSTPPRGGRRHGSGSLTTSSRFQSTPPRGGRPIAGRARLVASVFQSTPPRGGRPASRRELRRTAEVSIHAPAWGATIADRTARVADVSIHAPAWGRLADGPQRPALQWFQSTPPRGGRRKAVIARVATAPVSIHAPAWGRRRLAAGTVSADGFNPRPRVGGDVAIRRRIARVRGFNPRPRVGGDLVPPRGSTLPPSFNPRPRVGGDWCHREDRRSRQVSIHAPAWGATRTEPRGFTRGGDKRRLTSMFQSTPPRGGRPSTGRGAGATNAGSRLQSTPPRGGRPGSAGRTRGDTDRSFNPRPRVGGDAWYWVGGDLTLFQSTLPAWGRLLYAGRASPPRRQFQSTPPAWGATRPQHGYLAGVDERRAVSIHAPAWGATD